MNPTTSTSTNTNNLVVKPVPPDQISPKAVVLRIMELRKVFRRNWKLIAILVGLGGVIGFIVDKVNKKNPLYDASMTFNLGGSGGGGNGLGDLGALAGAFGLAGSTPDANIFVGDNFLMYAKSRPVIEKTLMKTVKVKGIDTLLVNYYIRHSGIRDKEWEDNDTLRAFTFTQAKKPEDYTKQEINVMSQINTRIKTEFSVSQPERKVSFMELRSAMEDEQLAQVFVETHLETIEEDYKQKQTKKTRQTYDLLKARTDSLARLLAGTENRLAQYMNQNQQVVVAEGQLTQSRLTRNSGFLTTLYYSSMQNLENTRISLIRESPLFTVIDPVSLPLQKTVRRSVATQLGIAIGLLVSLLIVFFRETYRSIMREE